jgi:hypothetical protein
LLHHVVMGNVAEFSEIHGASIIRVCCYLLNVGSIAHSHTVQQPTHTINIYN